MTWVSGLARSRLAAMLVDVASEWLPFLEEDPDRVKRHLASTDQLDLYRAVTAASVGDRQACLDALRSAVKSGRYPT